MKNRIFVPLAVLALALPALAFNAAYSSGAAGISVTQANTYTAFTNNHSEGDAVAFKARHVLIRSRDTSADTCHFDLGDGVATTADHTLAPGAAVELSYDEKLGGDGWTGLGAICAAGLTATWDVDAWR